jgi:hypothetical protein
MKVDYQTLLDELNKIQDQKGDLMVFIAILMIIVIFILITYLKYKTKSIAEEASQKAVAEFENNLADKLQTQIGLFFRDESVRNNLLTSIGNKSIEVKISSWQTLQRMYFQYQKSWNFSNKTEIEEYTQIDNALFENRETTFINTVYLGYFVSQKMIRLNSLMRENVRLKMSELFHSGNNYEPHKEKKLTDYLDRQSTNEQTISDLLYEIEKWLIDNLHSDQTVDKFEFTKEQLDYINQERQKKFEKIERAE